MAGWTSTSAEVEQSPHLIQSPQHTHAEDSSPALSLWMIATEPDTFGAGWLVSMRHTHTQKTFYLLFNILLIHLLQAAMNITSRDIHIPSHQCHPLLVSFVHCTLKMPAAHFWDRAARVPCSCVHRALQLLKTCPNVSSPWTLVFYPTDRGYISS